MKKRMMGFTLVELSLVLLALGLILPGAIIFWKMAERQRVTMAQTDVQQQSYDALLGFLHANYRLPCPAGDANGIEDCTDARQVGFMPWRTLALPRPEAGGLRYGVHRAPSGVNADAWLDQDLAVRRDRMNPLRVPVPNPKPQNSNTAPNPHLPPVPSTSAVLLGMTQSGSDSVLFNVDCKSSSVPACPLGVENAVNLLDICLALNNASASKSAVAGMLALEDDDTKQYPAAFVIAAPGMLDADGKGSVFDGLNATASNTSPIFQAPSYAVTEEYDDLVLAASHTELFSKLHCGAALSAIAHGHFNVGTGALVLERAMYDYRDQLYISVVLAEADVLSAAAGTVSAVAGTLDAAKELVSATADTTMSVGARSFQIGLSIAGIALAVVSDVMAVYAVTDAGLSLTEAQDVHRDFATRTTAMTDLSRSINDNALTADAIGH